MRFFYVRMRTECAEHVTSFIDTYWAYVRINVRKKTQQDEHTLLSAHAGQKQKLWRDQMKENRSLSPWGWMVPIFKMRRFSCLLQLPLTPEMGEMVQTCISEIEWFAAIKCRATGLSTGCCSLRNEGIQRICQIDADPFHLCKVYNIYCNKCSKYCK